MKTNDGFDFFQQKFGVGFDRREVSDAVIERYHNRLPQRLLEYWQAYGWCGYADGLFWTVNPQDYEPVVDAFLDGTEFEKSDTYHVIAKNGFGELYLWGEETAQSLTISSYLNKYSYHAWALKRHGDPLAVTSFFAFQSLEYNDLDGLFSPALRTLGRLKHDEIYGFVPALAFGGEPSLKRLKKVKDVEHMLLLAQLEPMQHWDFSNWESTET